MLSLGEWRLQNNPGYYGSAAPRTLVLGFCKGANQNRAAVTGEFDKIAFARARPRLQAVLIVLGLMPRDRSIQFTHDPDLDLLFERLDEGKAISPAYVPDPPHSRYENGKKPDVRVYARE